MSTSTFAQHPHTSLLSVAEGAVLGIALAWWLQMHAQPAPVIVVAGIVATTTYLAILNTIRGSSFSMPMILVSMAIWGTVGWLAGPYLYQWCGGALMRGALLTSPHNWRIGAAIVLVFIAFFDRAPSLTGDAR